MHTLAMGLIFSLQWPPQVSPGPCVPQASAQPPHSTESSQTPQQPPLLFAEILLIERQEIVERKALKMSIFNPLSTTFC